MKERKHFLVFILLYNRVLIKPEQIVKNLTNRIIGFK